MNNADCYFNMTIAILNDNVYIIDRQQLTSMAQRQEVLQHMAWSGCIIRNPIEAE